MTSLERSKGRVLLIEDELPLLNSYYRSLGASGFDVVRASKGREGLERLKRGDFDVILTDISMPGLEGWKVLEQLQSGYPDIPVVVMLDAVDNRTAIKAAELGAVQYLIKPIAADALDAAASRAIRMKHKRRDGWRYQREDRSEMRVISSVTATEAKNEFGKILENAIRGARVFITKHDARKAVLISVDDFEVLSASTETKLETLNSEFDALLSGMQARGMRSKMKAAFGASPKQLGRAAVEAARKRG